MPDDPAVELMLELQPSHCIAQAVDRDNVCNCRMHPSAIRLRQRGSVQLKGLCMFCDEEQVRSLQSMTLQASNTFCWR